MTGDVAGSAAAKPVPNVSQSPPAGTAPDAARDGEGFPWRMVVILVSAGMLLCVGAGVLVGIGTYSRRQEAAADLQHRYDLVEHHLRNGDHDQALEAAQELMSAAPQSPEAAKAGVLARAAQARLDLARGDTDAAQRNQAAARRLLDQAAQTRSLRAWARSVRSDDGLLPQIDVAAVQAQRVLDTARQLLAKGEPQAAMRHLGRELRVADLSGRQQDELIDLQGEIYRVMFRDAIQRNIAAASRLTDLGRYDQADWAFVEAMTDLQQAKARRYLPEPQSRELETKLSAAIDRLANVRMLQTADGKIAQARDRGDLTAEREALRQAVPAAEKVSPSRVPALKDRLAAVELEVAFADALARARQAKPDEAVRILDEFVAAHPGHAEAASALAAMKADRQWGNTIAEGDAAMRAGQWELARSMYQEAARLKKAPPVEERLAHAEYELAMRQARKARDEKRYDEALAEAAKAAAAFPLGAQRAEAWRQETLRQQKYESDLRQAKSAFDAGDHKQAERILQAMDPQTPEVLALRDQLAYQEQLREARDAMRVRDYAGAYNHLTLAKEHARPGEEQKTVTELMARLEPLLRAPPPAAVPPPPPEPRLGLIRSPLYVPFGYNMYPLYSNGYFPYVTFGYGDQVYLGGEYYPVFSRGSGWGGGVSGGTRRVLKPKPVLRAGTRVDR